MSSIQIPVIDLKEAQNASQRLGVAQKLVKALETDGFLFLDNMPGVDLNKLLKNTEWFFSIPETDKSRLLKKQWNPQNSNRYRGYFPLQPNCASYKEGFEMGAEDVEFTDPDIHPIFKEPNVWPQALNKGDQFKADMIQLFSAMLKTGSEVLRLVAMGSGLDEMLFDKMFIPDTLSTLRLLHYPKRPNHFDIAAATADDGTVLSCSEHTDSGFVTLLATFDYPGLQIKSSGGQWYEVPPRPGSLVVNIGDILSQMTGGRLKATRHRVVDPKISRYSVPFFFEPRYGVNINYRLGDSETKTPESVCAYGHFVIDKLMQFSEYQNTFNDM
ncbi:2-oxoglutarate-dependent dioxygenase citB-like [Gigantopelta aegis]|uniref:2-oxoglutarate-dependent dioxygenase citB-like n=1 Tax=Gigantopelta aegis TaxID=1735272 RepID=UPI001B88A961|nr:2-oxoglutarate-dependent dioxygenase citB-like [Gigantopelta aegis]XP_041365764.1 2-oxoglutarate-dependent dioxygenase citB-like [Gigantopelta aegis]